MQETIQRAEKGLSKIIGEILQVNDNGVGDWRTQNRKNKRLFLLSLQNKSLQKIFFEQVFFFNFFIDLDETAEHHRSDFHRQSLKYVDTLLSVEEEKKFQIPEHIHLYTQIWCTAFEDTCVQVEGFKVPWGLENLKS